MEKKRVIVTRGLLTPSRRRESEDNALSRMFDDPLSPFERAHPPFAVLRCFLTNGRCEGGGNNDEKIEKEKKVCR